MRISYFVVMVGTGLACGLGVQAARADLYKWLNEDGTVVISDTPPDNLNLIIEVFPAVEANESSAPAPPAAEQQTRELRALNQRLELLTQVLETERRFDAIQSYAPPPPQYVAAEPPTWNGWSDWWFDPPFFAPAAVIVSSPFVHHFPKFRHFNKFGHGHKFGHAHKFGHGHKFGGHKFGHAHPGFVRSQPHFTPRVGGVRHFQGHRSGGFRRR